MQFAHLNIWPFFYTFFSLQMNNFLLTNLRWIVTPDIFDKTINICILSFCIAALTNSWLFTLKEKRKRKLADPETGIWSGIEYVFVFLMLAFIASPSKYKVNFSWRRLLIWGGHFPHPPNWKFSRRTSSSLRVWNSYPPPPPHTKWTSHGELTMNFRLTVESSFWETML